MTRQPCPLPAFYAGPRPVAPVPMIVAALSLVTIFLAFGILVRTLQPRPPLGALVKIEAKKDQDRFVSGLEQILIVEDE